MALLEVFKEVPMDISLFQAVRERNCVKVRELTENNPQILETVTPLGNTALHVAASRKDYELAELLLSLKPCIVLMMNMKQETVLHKAAAAGRFEVMELLLKLKSNKISCNSTGCVHPEGYDLEGGGLNLDVLWKAQNIDGETALHYAARGDYVEIVKLLLEEVNGIELTLNKAGKSALFTACQSGSVELIKMLGERDSIFDTCLHQLIKTDCPLEAVLYLLGKRPALAKEVDDLGNAPLHLASIGGNRKIVEMLLNEAPEMALQKNKDEMAAIHYAARMGHTAIVCCLIEEVPHCIEVLGKDKKNVLHFALEYGHLETATALMRHSMDPSFLINEADNDGQTALHKAASSFMPDMRVIHSMLEISRWNVNAVDAKGLAPLDIVRDKIVNFIWFPVFRRLQSFGARRAARIDFLLKRSKPLLESPEEEDGGVEKSPKKYSEVEKDAGKNLSVVATLIFTVSFAAALTVPGGLRSDNGVPLRMHSTALQCFTVCNAIAFCFSILAMLMLTGNSGDTSYFCVRKDFRFGYLFFTAVYHKGRLTFGLYNSWVRFSGLDMLYPAVNATMVSFITGVYVMVAPTNFSLAIAVSTGVLITFIGYNFMYNFGVHEIVPRRMIQYHCNPYYVVRNLWSQARIHISGLIIAIM